ncbi:MAG TPA: aspartate carbamoyltransferase regulatory subunit [Lachnospiraceae bacterium]|nr:aspartate carbamoyltransferase regulatory subunit [Lachnospiraceae bacterium]
MLNISGIHEGYVLDHIKAGQSMEIYHHLHLEDFSGTVAMIMNVESSKMGRKDIIKLECDLDAIDLDILGYIDHSITVNVIHKDKIVDKKILKLPKKIKNVIKCRNPRCITSIEQGLDQVFVLCDEDLKLYRCQYCEEKYSPKGK